MKTATFVWTVTVEVADDFCQCSDVETMQAQLKAAKHLAYLNVQESQGSLTDVETDGPKFSDLIELVIE